MSGQFINLNLEHLEREHLCCAIADKKHQCGVDAKKQWLRARIPEGHIFRKLDEKGKVFIEYAPLETAWVPVEGDNYLYIHCLWVAGSFKGKGYGHELLSYCLDDARARGKSGVCVISTQKKTPYLSDKKFLTKYGFVVADTAPGGYELLSLSFDGTSPRFAQCAKAQTVGQEELTIYYGVQCPYIPNCVHEVKAYCEANAIPLRLIAVDTLEKAKNVPCVFNNWAVFHKSKFVSTHLLNEGYLKKMLSI